MQTVIKDELQYEVAENISAPHMFTTRKGGVSEGYLSSMNIGTRRGDKRENVLKNYEILGKAIGFDPKKSVHTKQTHTDIVRLADILGHSSINTTRIYTMETGETHRKQIQKLGLLRC